MLATGVPHEHTNGLLREAPEVELGSFTEDQQRRIGRSLITQHTTSSAKIAKISDTITDRQQGIPGHPHLPWCSDSVLFWDAIGQEYLGQ